MFNTIVRFTLDLVLPAAVLGNLFTHPLAEMLGTAPQIHTEAVRYMRYIVSLPPLRCLRGCTNRRSAQIDGKDF